MYIQYNPLYSFIHAYFERHSSFFGISMMWHLRVFCQLALVDAPGRRFDGSVPQADIAVLVVPAAEELEQEKDSQLMALMWLKFESEAPQFFFPRLDDFHDSAYDPCWVLEDFKPHHWSWILILQWFSKWLPSLLYHQHSMLFLVTIHINLRQPAVFGN